MLLEATPPTSTSARTATKTDTITMTDTLTLPKTILVASTNPVKILAAARAFARMFPQAGPPPAVRGLSVPSGVPDQPLSDATTLQGARNRVEGARAAEPGADYWVGIEGGVDEDPYPDLGSELGGGAALLQSFAWVVVLGRDGTVGKARTAMYYLPGETSALVRGGMELGRADEVVFGGVNTKQKNGSVGLLTGDVVERRGYYEEAVVLALIPFRNRELSF